MKGMKSTFLAVLIMLLMVSATWAGQKMSVQVRRAAVKASPSYTSRNVTTLNYGTRVDVIAEQDNWAHLSSPSGWLHTSALTTSDLGKVNKNYTGSNLAYDEVALAGKGFNPQVEDAFKASNRSMASAYNDVDRVERFTVSDAELRQFVKIGQLTLR